MSQFVAMEEGAGPPNARMGDGGGGGGSKVTAPAFIMHEHSLLALFVTKSDAPGEWSPTIGFEVGG